MFILPYPSKVLPDQANTYRIQTWSNDLPQSWKCKVGVWMSKFFLLAPKPSSQWNFEIKNTLRPLFVRKCSTSVFQFWTPHDWQGQFSCHLPPLLWCWFHRRRKQNWSGQARCLWSKWVTMLGCALRQFGQTATSASLISLLARQYTTAAEDIWDWGVELLVCVHKHAHAKGVWGYAPPEKF